MCVAKADGGGRMDRSFGEEGGGERVTTCAHPAERQQQQQRKVGVVCLCLRIDNGQLNDSRPAALPGGSGPVTTKGGRRTAHATHQGSPPFLQKKKQVRFDLCILFVSFAFSSQHANAG